MFAATFAAVYMNIAVAHIQSGDLSGHIDGSVRHSITKLAHIHFVANQEAANRIKQMGERPESIFEIGSPDIDVMISENLPSLESVISHYQIPFNNFAIVLYHPITTEIEKTLNDLGAKYKKLNEEELLTTVAPKAYLQSSKSCLVMSCILIFPN